jgi:hypothetical protein
MEKLSPPAGSDEPAGDDTKKARAEHFQAIRNKIDEFDDACVQNAANRSRSATHVSSLTIPSPHSKERR